MISDFILFHFFLFFFFRIGLLSVPSYATILTLKKSIEHRGNVCPLTQKNLVQLDWVSKEDGSHILTVGVCSYLPNIYYIISLRKSSNHASDLKIFMRGHF